MIDLFRAIGEQDGIIDNDRERLIMAEAVYPVLESRLVDERQTLADDIQQAINALEAGKPREALLSLAFLRGTLQPAHPASLRRPRG